MTLGEGSVFSPDYQPSSETLEFNSHKYIATFITKTLKLPQLVILPLSKLTEFEVLKVHWSKYAIIETHSKERFILLIKTRIKKEDDKGLREKLLEDISSMQVIHQNYF